MAGDENVWRARRLVVSTSYAVHVDAVPEERIGLKVRTHNFLARMQHKTSLRTRSHAVISGDKSERIDSVTLNAVESTV